MKKALLAAIVLAASTLVGLGVSASPAQAAGCGKVQIKYGGRTAVDGITHAPQFTLLAAPRVHYRVCSNQLNRIYVKVEAYKVHIRHDSQCGAVDRIRVNPNAIDQWNPGAKEFACNADGDVTLAWWAPDSATVYPGQPANERCIGGRMVFEMIPWNDPSWGLDSICVI